VVRTVGDADASTTRAVGSAEADVTKLKFASMESGNYAMVRVAEALAKGGVKFVPDIIACGGATGGTLVDVLLANVIRDASQRLPARTSAAAAAPQPDAAPGRPVSARISGAWRRRISRATARARSRPRRRAP